MVANGSRTAQNCRITGNTIVAAHRHGIYQAKGSGTVITGNTILNHRIGATPAGSAYCAIVVSRSHGIVVSNNSVINSSDGVLEVSEDFGWPAYNVAVTGNVFRGAAGTTWWGSFVGIEPPTGNTGSSHVTFTGNTWYQNGTNFQAITLYEGKEITINANHFTMLGTTSYH